MDRWVLIAAHYAEPASGRAVVIAAFDSEEPPHDLSPTMGSMRYARDLIVPLERTDIWCA